MTRSTCFRPLRGGMNFSTPSEKRIRPTLSLLRMAEKARTEAISAASSRLDCATEPNRPEPLRSEEHTSELQSRGHLVCRLLLEKKKKNHTPLAIHYKLALLDIVDLR